MELCDTTLSILLTVLLRSLLVMHPWVPTMKMLSSTVFDMNALDAALPSRAEAQMLAASRRSPLAQTAKLCRAFNRDHRGSIPVIFAFSLFPLVAAVGLAVDTGRVIHARQKTQTALDNAALAGARTWQVENNIEKSQKVATTFYQSSKSTLGTSSDFKIDANKKEGEIGVSVVVTVPMHFLAIIGLSRQTIRASSAARIDRGSSDERKIEIALMLDTTGSMCDPCKKLEDLKAAAKDLITIVVGDSTTARIALAPFSDRVNVGDFAASVTGLPATSGKKILLRCVTERTGSEAFTDAKPDAQQFIGPYDPAEKKKANYSNSGECSPVGEIVPLTNDQDLLRSSIDRLTTNGATAGHLGTAWAWYLLSPKWRDIWPKASAPADYDEKVVRKIAILMTDGDYNIAYSDQGDSDGQAKKMCAAMKRSGVIVYAVGLAIGKSQGKGAAETLKACVSDSSYFYDASDGEQLRTAFRDIALKLAPLRISR
jgi:Flp pilus assembly protein TadG